MSEQLKKILSDSPGLLDFYNTGPDQQASIEFFVQSLVNQITTAVKLQEIIAENQATYSDFDKAWCTAKVIQSKRIILAIDTYHNNLVNSK